MDPLRGNVQQQQQRHGVLVSHGDLPKDTFTRKLVHVEVAVGVPAHTVEPVNPLRLRRSPILVTVQSTPPGAELNRRILS